MSVEADRTSARRSQSPVRPAAGRSRLLARSPRAAHRPHGLQGRLAGAVAAVARRARDGLLGQRRRREPSLYELARVGEGMESIEGDVRDPQAIAAAVARRPPEVVIHMAAQSLVRRSFAEPRETYETNVMGTVNVLDAVRLHGDGVRAVVNVTSDKCYENREWEWGYREDEPMGGHDPYSSSKGCAELVTAAFRRSFFSDPGRRPQRSASGARGQRDRRRRLGRGPPGARHHARGARRRAGARAQPQLDPPVAARAQPAERLPACSRRRCGTRPSTRRAGTSARPRRTRARSAGSSSASASCGPGSCAWACDDGPHPHEARYLKLDSSRARARLGWRPLVGLDAALAEHRRVVRRLREGADMRAVTMGQIEAFQPTRG